MSTMKIKNMMSFPMHALMWCLTHLFKLFVDCNVAFLSAVLRHESVQDAFGALLVRGLNDFLTQPDLNDKIQIMSDTMSKNQEEAAQKAGQEFPKLVGNFIQGMMMANKNKNNNNTVTNMGKAKTINATSTDCGASATSTEISSSSLSSSSSVMDLDDYQSNNSKQQPPPLSSPPQVIHRSNSFSIFGGSGNNNKDNKRNPFFKRSISIPNNTKSKEERE